MANQLFTYVDIINEQIHYIIPWPTGNISFIGVENHIVVWRTCMHTTYCTRSSTLLEKKKEKPH
jgi:hypothetical protein